MRGSLGRYRVMAWVTGVGLVVLVFVGVPLQVWGHDPVVAKVFGTAHGYLFLVYLAATFALGRQRRWSLLRLAGVMAAGTIPFLSFVMERRVSREEPARP